MSSPNVYTCKTIFRFGRWRVVSDVDVSNNRTMNKVLSKSAEDNSNENVFGRAVKGGAWLFVARIFQQLVALARFVILSHMLDPDDFGLLAVAQLSMLAMSTFTQTGFRAALIQKKGDIRPYLDTVWTIEFFRGIILFGLLYVIAPSVAVLIKSPDATPIVRVIGVCFVIGSLGNIGTVYFRKELQFNKIFVLTFVGQIVSFVVSVWLAYVYRTVWAIVWGRLAMTAVSLLLTYLMHPYRPRLSFDISRAKELWGFGKHMLGTGILKYVCNFGDDWFVGWMLGSEILGFYRRAFELGNMVATEIGNRISTVSFSVYSKLQDKDEKLRGGFFKSLHAVSLIVLPVTGGFIAMGTEFVGVVLGEKWLGMIPALQILCLTGVMRCMQWAPIFMAKGRVDIITRMATARMLITVVTIYPLTAKWGIVGTSICVLAAGVAVTPIAFYELRKLVGIKFTEIMGLLSYPALATLIMMASIYFSKFVLPGVNALNVVCLIGIGAVSYLATVFVFARIFRGFDVGGLIRDIVKGLRS